MSLSTRLAKLERQAFPREISPEEAFRELAAHLYGWSDSIIAPSPGPLRDLCITPYDGAYGNAGYVLTINGSPPRGIFVTAAYRSVVYITSDGHARRLGEAQREIVLRYLVSRGLDTR